MDSFLFISVFTQLTMMASTEIENQQQQQEDSDTPDEDVLEALGYEMDDHHPSGSVRSSRRRLGVTAEKTSFNLSYHPNRVKLYSPPRQRQRWGDTQVLPRTNWGDLFFDLFYVAATYNISYILVKDPNRTGLLYAAGTFLPVMHIWLGKTVYDGRFVYEDDIFHRLLEVALNLVVAFAMLYIRPVKYMANAAGDDTVFLFSLMLILERIGGIVMYLEIYFFGIGQRKVLRKVARMQILSMLPTVVFYCAAAVVAGVEYYGDSTSDDQLLYEAEEHSRRLAGNETSPAAEYSGSNKSYTDVPIWLILAGFIFAQVYLVVNVVCCFPGGGRHKKYTVPINIEFIMHRTGEWTMLMLGESVFSILIVDVPKETSQYYLTFYCGILAVVLLHLLHFRSQPETPDKHASRRDKNAGIAFLLFQQVYSLALVCLGAAYTFFLTSFENSSADDHRRLNNGRRELAESYSDEVSMSAAHLFCGSLAVIFFCLDSMLLLHIGIEESKKRCVCAQSDKTNIKGALLVFTRVGLLAFTATLSQWEQDPETLSLVGLMLVFLQLLLRKLGGKYLLNSQVHADPASH